MKNPIIPEGAASTQKPLPPVPTTKILATSHFMGMPMTAAQRAQIMPHEVHDTVNAYLAGKIDQWYFRTDGKGVVFIVNASTPEEAKNIVEKFPLGQDYIPLGPLSPLRIINDMVK
jgi:hypothetical protein